MPVHLPNGDLVYAMNEDVPKVLQGYIKKGAHHFKSIFPPCKYRVEKDCEMCGGQKTKKIDHCLVKNTSEYLQCYKCPNREEEGR
jgi:hypothetical protein